LARKVAEEEYVVEETDGIDSTGKRSRNSHHEGRLREQKVARAGTAGGKKKDRLPLGARKKTSAQKTGTLAKTTGKIKGHGPLPGHAEKKTPVRVDPAKARKRGGETEGYR